MNKTRKYHPPFLLFTLIFFAFTLISYNCYSKQANKAVEYEKIKLQLKYTHQFQFAGYYAAIHKGFFKEEGLEVELLEGDTINTINQVLMGKADYGISSNDILLAYVNNKPIVLLSAIFQRSPSIFLSLKESNIHSAHDLINKRIMLLDEFRDPELLAIFFKEGIHSNDFTRLNSSYDINDLINKKTDVLNAYSTNEPYLLNEQNIAYSIIHPQTYGIDFYGDGIFTSKKEVNNHPKRVDAFLRASKKGWEYALNNTDEIIDIIITTYKVDKSKKHLEFEAQEIKKLILNEYIEIGHINPGRLDHIAKICAEMGMISPNYNLENFIYKTEKTKAPLWLKWTLLASMLLASIIAFYTLYLFFFTKKLKIEVAKQTLNLNLKNKELEKEIIERKSTEEALKKSEKRFREMIENLPSGAILIEGNRLFTNKKAFEITEYTNKELPDLESWFRILYPKKEKENLEFYQSCKKNSFRIPGITTILTKSGKKLNVEFHGYCFDNKEIWLMNDITQRLATEKALASSEYKLRTYINESPSGMLIFNENTKITFSNPAFAKLLDLETPLKSDYSIKDFFPPKQIKKNKNLLYRLMINGKAQGEVYIQSLKGRKIPAYISAVKIKNNEFLGFVLDISHIKKVEHKLKIALKKAEESDRLKSAFLANMSHEIRTPMNGILGFSQLLGKENLSPEKKNKYIDILDQNGKQLLEIINNIIEISYLEVKLLKLIINPFSISKLFADLEIFFNQEKLKYKKTHLKISFTNKVPKQFDEIHSDLGKIKQVLINLINNALKFTKEGFIKVSVDLNNSLLEFSVEDSGIGIPKEKQDLIFQRFGQIEDVYTRQFGGAGLGLPISKGIVELLNGEMYLKSEKGAGSKFIFIIPHSLSKQKNTPQ
ncbi:ABC transporter substrate-binding protein [Marinifilum sp. RC60d5]|uniref:ABC transporter substrate-binding protein n=1 Tax=Marinifilum sp. RC60d5 TaxID=3458414 RepID=UPI0040372CEF